MAPSGQEKPECWRSVRVPLGPPGRTRRRSRSAEGRDKAEASLATPELSDDGSVLTVTVPLAIQRRGSRKRIITPDGEPDWAPRREVNSALVNALARGFRWKRLIEDGHYGSIVELAAAEKISQSYVRRLLRLTLLSPKIVEAVLDGREAGLQLEDLREECPVKWEEQNFR